MPALKAVLNAEPYGRDRRAAHFGKLADIARQERDVARAGGDQPVLARFSPR
jgi:hypothetical protein